MGVWVTNRPLYKAFVLETLFPQWGLVFHGEWLWLKVCTSGAVVTPLESTHKQPFERLLVGVRRTSDTDGLGNRLQQQQQQQQQPPRVVVSVPLRHSWKPPPEAFFGDLVEDDDAKLELFARELRPHWTSVGFEVRHAAPQGTKYAATDSS